ncbi:MAG: hypothetical protein FJ279_14040 [Planctomycetes bacterium]|nr:hypothetical protein [Planctomycetota bacterium]
MRNMKSAMWGRAILGALMVLGHGLFAADTPAPKLKTMKVGEWYTVTCPEVFHIGTEAQIVVAYRGIAEKTKLCCDLHYAKTDGRTGGFYANDWRGKPEIQGEGKHTFRVNITERESLATVTIMVFTDPAGKWGSHTRFATSERIPVVDPDPSYTAWFKNMKWNRSWLAIDWGALQRPLVEGDKIEVPVEYHLDPSEHHGTTTLRFEALGPRVPKPDAPRPVTFDQTQHLYHGQQKANIQPGRGKHVFPLTIPKSSAQNSLLLIASLVETRGKRWPWDVRARAWFVRKGGFFELETEKPGNLFTYDEPVRILARLKNVKAPGEQKTVKFKVHDCAESLVAEGAVPFKVEKDGQTVPIDLKLTRRGIFLIQAEVDGWEARETTFCRIPDLGAITKGQPTRFGMTAHSAPWLAHRTEETLQIARRLGLTHCRAFTEWAYIEPGPGVFKLEHWDRFFDAAQKHAIETVICLYHPPAWVLPQGETIGYRMFGCDFAAFKDMVATVTQRYRGKFWGWEWLNEISPGGTPNCVDDYVKLCRTGTETARALDPSLKFVLAGGLWPRGFRLEVLNAGIGQFVDVLPIHYGNGSAVQEAREDLEAYGHSKAAVWDNESCAFVIAWGWPGLAVVSETVECNWVLTQWADELAAGCDKIIYFGGQGNATGNGDYLLTDHSPRPVAATLAVFAAKTHDAKPVGVFASVGKGGVFHVFERAGQPILVASSSEDETVPLAVGTPAVRITDYQGNETELATQNGVAKLPLKPLRCFVEGADLDVLRTYLVPALHTPSAGGKREPIGGTPQIPLLKGMPAAIPIRLHNLYARPLTGTLRLDLPASWMKEKQAKFALSPGERKVLSVAVSIPDGAPLAALPQKLTVTFDSDKLPPVVKPFVVTVISPENIGNLLTNGDFEEADGQSPKAWSGTNGKLAPSEGLGLGLGKHVLKFEKTSEWAHYSQRLTLPGGMTYLYTAWIWNQGMAGGSNISQTMKDGSRKDLYNKQVMDIGDSTPYWQLFTCRYKAPEDLNAAGFVPALRGQGSAFYDNLRVTAFEGTDFAAEAFKVKTRPAIDGKLDDWDAKCPIPLIGKNQLRVRDKGYEWTPKNLNGVAYLRWDEANLYVAIQVLDDAHHAAGDGDGVVEGDSVILAFDPTNRGPEGAKEAFAYYASSQKPAGGSGVHTLWRPSKHSAGRPAGHLARDSSVYELAIKPEPGGCVYELRLPLSELGLSPSSGAKFAFALQLNDNDGKGLAAHINWGGGLSPAWSPASFGVVTFVE